MGRVPFGKASKGSQKWIQDIINERPELINQSIIKKIDQIEIQWLSPLKEDDHAEYKDEEFLHKLGVELTNRELKEFWPTRGGPQWDALGKSNSSKVFLVEAKSHIGEINSPGTGAKSEKSKELITNSLREVKHYLNVRNDVDWSRYFYQYTNRLAHLYFLRVLNSIDAYLVFVYFLNDHEMGGPLSVDEWKGANSLLKVFLGIKRNKLEKYIVEVFIDIGKLV